MAGEKTNIFLLNGDDAYSIRQRVAALESGLGDPAMVEMNTTRLDGRSLSLGELANAVAALPFLLGQRLVVVTHPSERLKNQKDQQKRFIDIIEKMPPSTRLLLVEYQPLTEERDRRQNKLHWLERWAIEQRERVSLELLNMPRGPEMTRWIQSLAHKRGGKFSSEGADTLAGLVGGDTGLAAQEVDKLLTYVNYRRPVEREDVELLTSDARQGDIFRLVDAIAERRGKEAMEMLHRLLVDQDAISIFGMIVRQFRLLLQAREVLDAGGNEGDVIRELRQHPYVGKKITTQAGRFDLAGLEATFRRLAEMDAAVKGGELDDELALDILVAGFTNPRG